MLGSNNWKGISIEGFKQLLKNKLPLPIKTSITNAILGVRRLGARRRVLPDFLIIGAQKAGTTFLYENIVQHPQVLPAFTKEVHYFDINHQKGPLWYRSHFPFEYEIKGHRITGEASPYYLFHPYALNRIHQLIPDVKLIILLRNPVDRAISHYFHEISYQTEKLLIEEAFSNEEQSLAPEYKKMQEDEFYHSFIYQHFSYKKRGIYVDQIKNCFNYFSTNQVLILRSEDLFSQPEAALREVFAFLDIRVDFVPHHLKLKNMGNYTTEIPESLYKHLTDYYVPHNERLYEYLNRNFGW